MSDVRSATSGWSRVSRPPRVDVPRDVLAAHSRRGCGRDKTHPCLA
jgi:hypothetical protein